MQKTTTEMGPGPKKRLVIKKTLIPLENGETPDPIEFKDFVEINCSSGFCYKLSEHNQLEKVLEDVLGFKQDDIKNIESNGFFAALDQFMQTHKVSLEARIVELRDKLVSAEDQVALTKAEAADQRKIMESDRIRLEKELEDLKKQIGSGNDQEEEIQALLQQRRELEEKLEDLRKMENTDVSVLQKEIEKLENELNEKEKLLKTIEKHFGTMLPGGVLDTI